jgi:hypothetical protein
MKRSLGIGAVAAFLLTGTQAAVAQDASPYGMAGCGLGSLVFKENGFVQVFAATTNATFGTQTFGITSGTSNCVKAGVVKADKEQEAFVESNLDNLERDMAAGGGEYLAAFATLLGCEESVQPELYSFAQNSYASVFPNDHTTAQQALYGFKVQASQNEAFARSCARL